MGVVWKDFFCSRGLYKGMGERKEEGEGEKEEVGGWR